MSKNKCGKLKRNSRKARVSILMRDKIIWRQTVLLKSGKFVEGITIDKEWKVFLGNGARTTVYWYGKKKHNYFLPWSVYKAT